MRSLTQSPSASHSLFPPLMLPAPKIAGLLGPGPQPDKTTYSYADPRLAAFTDDQRAKLFDAANVLLEVAVRFGTHELSDSALRAAASLFARKLTGRPAPVTRGRSISAPNRMPICSIGCLASKNARWPVPNVTRTIGLPPGVRLIGTSKAANHDRPRISQTCAEDGF